MQDRNIIEKLFARSEEGLTLLDSRYRGLIFSVMTGVLDNAADREECYNDFLMAVWNSIPPNRPDSLEAYLCTLSRRIAAMTDDMIVPTEKVRRLLLGYGVRTPIHVVPSGIDLGRFRGSRSEAFVREQRERLGIPQERKILVYVGRLAEEKNLEELLRFRANMGGEDITLLIVGGGPWKERLENAAAQLGLQAPDVVFAGMVPPETVASWYRMGDLFVSASTSETQGLTYVEALAAGTPALCRADECLEGVILEGENGWQYRTEEEFRWRVEEFFAAPEKKEAMSAAARAVAEEYSAERFGQRAEAIYAARIQKQGKVVISA